MPSFLLSIVGCCRRNRGQSRKTRSQDRKIQGINFANSSTQTPSWDQPLSKKSRSSSGLHSGCTTLRRPYFEKDLSSISHQQASSFNPSQTSEFLNKEPDIINPLISSRTFRKLFEQDSKPPLAKKPSPLITPFKQYQPNSRPKLVPITPLSAKRNRSRPAFLNLERSQRYSMLAPLYSSPQDVN